MKSLINPSVPIVIVFEDVEYICHKPKMGAVRTLEENLSAAQASGKGITKLLTDYIEACGLPSTVVDNLDTDQLEAVVEALTPKKKPSSPTRTK